MAIAKRPRVAAIGLEDAQLESLKQLCGVLRSAPSLPEYLQSYSWIETDIIVASGYTRFEVDVSVSVLTFGFNFLQWSDRHSSAFDIPVKHHALSKPHNNEWELTVPPTCPERYKPLAIELSSQLSLAGEPPAAIDTSRQSCTSLIETTSGLPVALRIELPEKSNPGDGGKSGNIALLLPRASNLVAWFRELLFELHEINTASVPLAPPRFSQPLDWYTPQETALAARITAITSEIERLSYEQAQLRTELAEEGERAERGIRRALWADGEDLVDVVSEILSDLGFKVRDMDSELREGEPKREDLRLSLQGDPNWQAIVEVKGYSGGTRTNDARQIREFRERFIKEEGRLPDLTLWISNPFRVVEPSSRPTPDQGVHDAAETVGAVHVLISDLYRQWALVTAGSLESETAVQNLANAVSGLWNPLARTSCV